MVVSQFWPVEMEYGSLVTVGIENAIANLILCNGCQFQNLKRVVHCPTVHYHIPGD